MIEMQGVSIHGLVLLLFGSYGLLGAFGIAPGGGESLKNRKPIVVAGSSLLVVLGVLYLIGVLPN